MSLKFINQDKGNTYLENEHFKIAVDNFYLRKRAEKIHEQVKKLLNGERNIKPMFSNYNGESWFTIDDNDTFILHGGEWTGMCFGSSIVVKCKYSENKEEIHKFMNYMITERVID